VTLAYLDALRVLYRGGGGYSQALFDAIKRQNDAGIIFVAAAGNGTITSALPTPARFTAGPTVACMHMYPTHEAPIYSLWELLLGNKV
jgi:hypothetical protein